MRTKFIKIIFGLYSVLFSLSPVYADQGGSDSFGYMWTNSAGAVSVDYEWIDAKNGTRLINAFNPGTVAGVELPFTFYFYGSAYDSLYISSNGWVSFTYPGTDSDPTNVTIPTGAGPDNMIAVFWDDLSVLTGIANLPGVYYNNSGVFPNQKFIIQWEGYRYSPLAEIKVQLVLYQHSHLIKMQYNYSTGAIAGGVGATVGIKQNTSDGIEYSFNTASISNNSAILFHNRILNSGATANLSPNSATAGSIEQFTYLFGGLASVPASLGKADRFTIFNPFGDVYEPVVTGILINGSSAYIQESLNKPVAAGYATWSYINATDSILIQLSDFDAISTLQVNFNQPIPSIPSSGNNYIGRYNAVLDQSPTFQATDAGYGLSVTANPLNYILIQSTPGDVSGSGVEFTTHTMTADETVT
ncbi:MAG: hypothetical protein JXR46_17110, partial [Calditrichaceae bacterium]|nr:hypothetical protein [Calditrichaceae bacterium]